MSNQPKASLLKAINSAVSSPLEDYNPNDYIFSEKYRISATDMVYILQCLAAQHDITISDTLIDSLEICTFEQLERLIGA